jgi:hypothetical protein
MVLARSRHVFVDGQNGFYPFLPHFLLRAKRIMPVFRVIFVTGQTAFAHLQNDFLSDFARLNQPDQPS